MKKALVAGLRFLGLLLLAHALMLIGADEITMLERGFRSFRSLDTILTLYRLDPKPWEMTLSPFWQISMSILMSWPGWAVFGGLGVALVLMFRPSD